jgi:signal transduction histidine kinase
MTSMQSMVEQLKESENNLLVAKHKAEESDKLKTAFLENISHEVRTPLNVILGFTQVFVKEDLETETKQDYLKFIHSSSERLIKIVEDIMFFSELEKGVLQLHCKPIDIDWLLSEIFCEFIEKNHIAEKQIKLNIVKPESNQIRYITSDVLFLKRAFQYLIENA